MHIAVLDDDVAARNQMNRLLTRISDANKKEGREGYYIDLYGNVNSLMPKAAMYDAIFIDMCIDAPVGQDIAEALLLKGYNAKIILCCSRINYRTLVREEDRDKFLFMDKPIKSDELPGVLEICEEIRASREPKIEFRTKTETLYVKYDDFLFAKAIEQSKTKVMLSSRGEIEVLRDLFSFRKDMSPYSFIALINKDTMINVNRIKKVSMFSVEIDGGATFPISAMTSSKLKNYLKHKK